MTVLRTSAPTVSPLSSTAPARFSYLSRWPDWAAHAAAIWSLLYALFGLWWALGGAGFPFGRSDPRADEVGSLFGWAHPTSMGAAIAGTGLLGCVVALTMAHPSRARRARLPLVFAWSLCALLVIAVPDIRVVQNFAYLFFAYTGKWDWPLAFMLFCMTGGVLWAAAGISYHRRVRHACEHCGRDVRGHDSASPARWGTWATYTAVAMAMPYPITRISWALDIPLGVPESEIADSSLGLRIGEAMLGGSSSAGRSSRSA